MCRWSASSFADFVTVFSQDSAVSDLARYVALFFANGGTTAYVVRVADGAAGDAPQPGEYRSAYRGCRSCRRQSST